MFSTMKKVSLLFLLFILNIITSKEFVFANSTIPSYNLLQNTAIRFSEGGIRFSIYLDGTFDYESSGERVTYNYSGGVSQIGNVFISYNYSGKVSQIGKVFISYNYNGKVNKVGCMFINYDYSGRVTGTSGNVSCGY
jgi:hypothetical protein